MPTVLTVGDGPSCQDVKSLLEECGFAVVSAADGQDAWEKSRTSDFNLVLTEQFMPRMDWLSLARKLHADLRFRDTPVLVLSADAHDEGKDSVHATAWLTKPIDPAKLLEAVTKAISVPKLP